MMTELILVEGVSDVLLISYYMQNVFGWKHEINNKLGIKSLDEAHEHIESLSKNGNEIILCGVGGNGRLTYFINQHRIREILISQDVASVLVVTDRDKNTDAKIGRTVSSSLQIGKIESHKWNNNVISDSFGQTKNINTYLLIIPENEEGALESVIIRALKDIPEHSELISKVIVFIETLRNESIQELKSGNMTDKATIGTFFSIRNPQNAMRAFASFIAHIDWSKSESLKQLFEPFSYLGEEKSR